MLVGVCWPSPGAAPQPLFDGEVLDRLKKATGATHLRVNFDHRRHVDEVVEHVVHIRAHGFHVLPILDFDYENPDPIEYALACASLASMFPAVELGNEPNTLHKMHPAEYADMFTAGASAIRVAAPKTQIYIACEPTKPPAKKTDYFAKVRALVDPSLYDVAAIHPYRNPQPPHHTPFGNREEELRFYQAQVPNGTGIAVTEVGWDLRGGVDENRQAEYVGEELRIWAALKVDAVYVFAHTDELSNHSFDFGILDRNLQPRPVAAAIWRFQAERGLA